MNNASVHIDPTGSQIRALAEAAGYESGPIVMTNLLRFAGGDGRDGYLRYAREVQPHLDRVGASIVYAGDAGLTVIGDENERWWDTILLVRYPSRAKFLEMVLDPGYQEIAVHRTNALANSALIVTDPWTDEF